MHQIGFDWLIGVYCSAMSRLFRFSRSDRRHRMYRRLGEQYSDACVQEVDRFGGGGSVMCLEWDFSWGENAPSGYSG